jgi:hypothetical protein
MSGPAVGKVFELELPQNKLLVMLAYADTAHNADGRGVRLSAPKVAWKTGYSERQARRIIDSLIADKLLEVVDTPNGQTPIININFAAGKKKSESQQNSTVEITATPDIAMSPLTSGQPLTFEHETPDIAMSETPDTIMSGHNVLTKDNVKDSPLPPTPPGESTTSPVADAGAVTVKHRQKTPDDLLFDAIAINMLKITDGNYDGVAGDISNYRRELKKGFKNPPVTPDEIRQFAEWYRRTKRDYTGKPLSFPNPYKIGKFFREFRDSQTSSGGELHTVPSFMLISGKGGAA